MRFALGLLSAVILIITIPNLGQASSFKDISLDYKHYNAVVALSDRGLIKGYADNSFRPDQTINRAEALKILVGANFSSLEIARALDEHKAKNHSYVNLSDVKISDWFSPYVELAFRKNIIGGYPDRTFKPTSTINFAEGLKMVIESSGATMAGFTPSKLLYVDKNDWFAPYFSFANSKNLINPNKFYHPAQLMTRGEFAEIVYRLNKIQSGGLEKFAAQNIGSNEYVITIPKLNIINQPVGLADPYDGGGALKVLDRFALGHYLAAPGSGKKFVLYGHSWGFDWYHSPFKATLAQIDRLQAGDMIYINYQEKGFAYQMYKNEIIPEKQDDVIMNEPEKNEMALYTCWPLNTTENRYVIYGKPI